MSCKPLRVVSCLRLVGAVALAAVILTPAAVRADVTLAGGGLVLAEQGGTFAAGNVAGASFGAIPFTSSDLGPELSIGFHIAANLNDEIYGNSNSWIGGNTNPFAPSIFGGVALDSDFTLQSIAFGRDNLGTFGDRNLGLYTLQYTTVAGVSNATPDGDWTTIGTFDYASAGTGNFSNPALRHRYNFDPVAGATGVRLLVPGGTAIDEIELYETAGTIVIPPPPPPPFLITPALGHDITWDGNDGDHFDPAAPPAGAQVPNNLALASNGAIAISSSDLGPELGVLFHVKGNLNDGIYGNSNSWIGGVLPAGVAAPFAGVALDGLFFVDQIAFSRDNGNGAFDDSAAGTDACGGQCDDRWQGVYTLQYTQVAGADGSTPDTGDPTTGWANVGMVDYAASVDIQPGDGFTGYLRHAFDVSADGSPLVASGIRLLVPATGLGGGTAIDEIEVYGSPVPEPSTFVMAMLALGGMAVIRRRRR